ncbi:hypothetical protein IFM89_026361 [Coptis chinensis]|uniref:Uncharacterized protein n=1 Tax=Coptis chinensis TaxID=261450 RepID=A0A835LNL0_9MAGN|nr:hypothetical protein IFM89_026361 [Coptis chinensis]
MIHMQFQKDNHVFAMISYLYDTLIRIGLDSTVSALKRNIYDKWRDVTPLACKFYFIRDEKKSSIDTDSELQSLALFLCAKEISSFKIFVGLDDSIQNLICDEVENCSMLFAPTPEVCKPLKSSLWATLITGVGQKISGGVVEFRNILLKYCNEKGFVYKLRKNNPYLVTAVCGKELAMKEVYGDDAFSYTLLEWYTDALQRTNPGSHIQLELDKNTRQFARLFISFEACIHGFNYCRPMVCSDGTFLKAKYKGCLLSATSKNADQEGQQMPLMVSKSSTCWINELANVPTALGKKMVAAIFGIADIDGSAYHQREMIEQSSMMLNRDGSSDETSCLIMLSLKSFGWFKRLRDVLPAFVHI